MTRPHGHRSYLLAQVSEDAPLEWVAEARTMLGVDELKFGSFAAKHEWLKGCTDVWSGFEATLKATTLIMVDTQPFLNAISSSSYAEDLHHAFTPVGQAEIFERAGRLLLSRVPFTRMGARLDELDLRLDKSALEGDGRGVDEHFRLLDGRLRQIGIFAARSEAVFDTPVARGHTAPTSPFEAVVLLEGQAGLRDVLRMRRCFDRESPRVTSLLNESTAQLATYVDVQPFEGQEPLIVEDDSTELDGLQAADVAAGWAKHQLEYASVSTAVATFGAVYWNGTRQLA